MIQQRAIIRGTVTTVAAMWLGWVSKTLVDVQTKVVLVERAMTRAGIVVQVNPGASVPIVREALSITPEATAAGPRPYRVESSPNGKASPKAP